MQFDFEWEPSKALANELKHRVSFGLASTVFLDPRALSVYDEEHSRLEDRWLTIGMAESGALLVLHHTFDMADKNRARIRVISARKATVREQRQYTE
jgi:uncharacterized protein